MKEGSGSLGLIKGEMKWNFLLSDQAKGARSIEESDLNPPGIHTVRHKKAVACLLSQGGLMQEILDDLPTLDLHQAY